MDKETGFGKPGPWWSVGVQAVEVELDTRDFTYTILKGVTVLDGGTIINPMTATQQMRGGMYMGLSYATSEKFIFDEQGVVQNPDFALIICFATGNNLRNICRIYRNTISGWTLWCSGNRRIWGDWYASVPSEWSFRGSWSRIK